MKIFSRIVVAAALLATATSCEKFLDINENPNNPTAVTPDTQLASALAITASNYTGGNPTYLVSFNNQYASFAAGYWGKSGTVSGFSEERTYNYSNSYQAGLWPSVYDNLIDYQQIQQGAATYPNHAAIARIMKVYNFLLLVDEYGDIPYTQALQGLTNTAPTYDKAEDIYKDLIAQLKGANTDIDAAIDATPVGAEDIVFGGSMSKWKQFSNSLRLRILLRESQTTKVDQNAVRQELATLQTQAGANGFITTDVVAQPGYAGNTNQQNPFYNRYGYPAGLTRTTAEYSYVMPTNYIIQQYQNNKDPRISQLYRQGQTTLPDGTTASSYIGTDLGERNPPTFTGDLIGSRFLIVTPTNPQGGAFLRGANAPTVLMLLSEHLFNKAEAETRGLFTGGDAAARSDFYDGIKASFIQTYRTTTTLADVNTLPLSAATAATPGITQYNDYISNNAINPLVSYDVATPDGNLGKQTVILYQKYLAENTIASTEAWDDYRRTGKPNIPRSLQAGTNPRPVRLLYPQVETNTNASNLPTNVTQFDKIFWDMLD